METIYETAFGKISISNATFIVANKKGFTTCETLLEAWNELLALEGADPVDTLPSFLNG